MTRSDWPALTVSPSLTMTSRIKPGSGAGMVLDPSWVVPACGGGAMTGGTSGAPLAGTADGVMTATWGAVPRARPVKTLWPLPRCFKTTLYSWSSICTRAYSALSSLMPARYSLSPTAMTYSRII